MKGTEADIDILAKTCWAEARGEGLSGMVAVAWTIRNRVEADLGHDGKPDWWGEGYAGVCQRPWQFSCWNKNDPNYPYLSGAKPIPKGEFQRCLAAAEAVITGQEQDPTGGATHYYNPKAVTKIPAWVKGATQTGQIGQHIFFKDVP